YAGAIHIWDLRAIRVRLKDMHLDWDWPELAPEVTKQPAVETITVEAAPGGQLAPALTREQKALQALERFRRAFDANPNSAANCNNLAWALATAPEALRNPAEAVRIAEKAVGLASESPTYRNTLGVAYYRTGRYREAAEM